MPRLSFDDVTAAVVAQVTDGITHADLVERIDPQHRSHLARVVSAGAIQARAESVANGRPVVRYYLPGSAPAIQEG